MYYLLAILSMLRRQLLLELILVLIVKALFIYHCSVLLFNVILPVTIFRITSGWRTHMPGYDHRLGQRGRQVAGWGQTGDGGQFARRISGPNLAGLRFVLLANLARVPGAQLVRISELARVSQSRLLGRISGTLSGRIPGSISVRSIPGATGTECFFS